MDREKDIDYARGKGTFQIERAAQYNPAYEID